MKFTLQLTFYSFLIYVKDKFDLICRFLGVKQGSKYRYLTAFCLLPLLLIIIPFLIVLAILLLFLHVIVVLVNSITFSLIAYSSAVGSVENNGIRLHRRGNKNNRLLLWEKIKKVTVISQPPLCSMEVVLKSGELIMAFTDHSNNVESALEKYNILFARKQKRE